MALKIIRDKQGGGMPIKADRKLYQTLDRSRVVEEGDPASAFLFCAAGSIISDEDMKRYGLSVKGGKLQTKAQAKAEDKMMAKAEDKARKKSKFPKAVGGGWYVLSNGEKVQGEDEAEAAEKAIK